MSVAHYDSLLPFSADALFISIYLAMPEYIRDIAAARQLASTITTNIAKNTKSGIVKRDDLVIETTRVLFLFNYDTSFLYGIQHRIVPTTHK